MPTETQPSSYLCSFASYSLKTLAMSFDMFLTCWSFNLAPSNFTVMRERLFDFSGALVVCRWLFIRRRNKPYFIFSPVCQEDIVIEKGSVRFHDPILTWSWQFSSNRSCRTVEKFAELKADNIKSVSATLHATLFNLACSYAISSLKRV